MIIAQLIRRAASEYGMSIQETFESIILAVRGSAIPFSEDIRCPLCQSQMTRITSTREEIRFHRCDFCGNNFRSEKQKSVTVTAKKPLSIAKQKKKPHIKDKRG